MEPTYNPNIVEEEIRTFWRDNDMLRKVQNAKRHQPLFAFLEGPPTANGFMHIGHVRGRTMKDVVLRYRAMTGRNVWRKAGWDCQGLPVEIEVEKKLDLKSKKDIEKIGYEKFVAECNNLVDFYIEHWRKNSERLGLWLDFDDAYETRREEYIEFIWWALKEAYKRGLLIEDYKVIPACPRCETPLSGHEVAQGYEIVTDPSIHVKFSLRNLDKHFMLVWTTTPWTMPGDEAVAVHPDFEYAFVKVRDEIWILANDLVQTVMGKLNISDHAVEKVLKGRELEGIKYVHPLLEETPVHRTHQSPVDHSIILGEHVTIEEGTGCVHTAPGHGPEDFEIGKKYGLNVFCPIDQTGRFTSESGKYAGKFVKDADGEIIRDLELKGLLVLSGKIDHEYPLCWRCNNPLIYRADKQWFLAITPMRDKMIAENKKIFWVPDWAGRSRFGEWLVNADDWCITRSRIWGSPLNMWRCEKCEATEAIGSKKELIERAVKVPERLELHRPWVDQVTMHCPECAGEMKRIPFVLDCWLDSGMAHAAGVNYLSSKAAFKRLFPYDFITEAVDQTRGWFYSLLATSTLLFDQAPYKSVLCQGHLLDKFGQKMSKSKGNVIWAEEAFEKYGADPIRVYLLSKASPEDALAFDDAEIEQVKRTLVVLWNVFAFANTYMTLDSFNQDKTTLKDIEDYLRPEDMWLISRLQTTVASVTENLEALRLHKSVRALLDFVLDDISRFYIRTIRRRTWVESADPEKLAAYWTLNKILVDTAKLLNPFAPHTAEKLYRSITNKHESVNLEDWPKVDSSLQNKALENTMVICQQAIAASLTARQKGQLKLRWPAQRVVISPKTTIAHEALTSQKKLLQSHMNARTVEILNPEEKSPFATNSIEPDFSKLGPKFKKNTQKIADALKKLDAGKVAEQLTKQGFVEIAVDEQTFTVDSDLLTIHETTAHNISSQEFPAGTVLVDTTQTPELLAESYTKEIVRRAQIMRKEMKLRIDEFVDLAIQPSERDTYEILSKNKDYIASEVRVKNMDIRRPDESTALAATGYSKEWNIEEEKIVMTMTQSSQ